jgi:hypothetical protein
MRTKPSAFELGGVPVPMAHKAETRIRVDSRKIKCRAEAFDALVPGHALYGAFGFSTQARDARRRDVSPEIGEARAVVSVEAEARSRFLLGGDLGSHEQG